MDDIFLSTNFKSIHITSDDAYGKCVKCGDHSEQWILGRLHTKKPLAYYTFPDLRLRKRTECSLCVEKTKMDSLARRIRSSRVFPKNCEICNSVFVSRVKRGIFCSSSCRYKHHNNTILKSYTLECEQCKGIFINNKKKKYCSYACERDSFRAVKELKSCKTCSNTFEGSSNKRYCGETCRPWSPNFICPEKERKCLKCDNMVIVPRQLCDPCKVKGKLRKPKKVYEKECPTCDKKFSTVYNYKIYCKPGHIPCHLESKKLRKRVEVKAKLSVETWKDILRFKKSRPEGMHLDHIIPLNHPDVCGLHNTWNFQWLTPSDNSKKSNKFNGTNENDDWGLKHQTHSLALGVGH